MKNITLKLDDEDHKRIRIMALQNDQTVTDFVMSRLHLDDGIRNTDYNLTAEQERKIKDMTRREYFMTDDGEISIKENE